MKHFFFKSIIVCTTLLTTNSSAFAQKGNSPNQDERKENERVDKAERSLAEVKKELSAILKEFRSERGSLERSISALPQLKKKAREAREEAEDRLGVKVGIPDALTKVRQARAAVEEIAVNVRDQLRKTAGWIQANEAGNYAKKARELLLDYVEQTDNDAKLTELGSVINKPLELENEAVARDPIAMDATKRLTMMQAELEKKRKLLPIGEVEKDPKVLQAMNEIEKKEKGIVAIESKLSKVRSEASKIQKRFGDAQLSLQRAKAADAADSNRPIKKKGK